MWVTYRLESEHGRPSCKPRLHAYCTCSCSFFVFRSSGRSGQALPLPLHRTCLRCGRPAPASRRSPRSRGAACRRPAPKPPRPRASSPRQHAPCPAGGRAGGTQAPRAASSAPATPARQVQARDVVKILPGLPACLPARFQKVAPKTLLCLPALAMIATANPMQRRLAGGAGPEPGAGACLLDTAGANASASSGGQARLSRLACAGHASLPQRTAAR